MQSRIDTNQGSRRRAADPVQEARRPIRGMAQGIDRPPVRLLRDDVWIDSGNGRPIGQSTHVVRSGSDKPSAAAQIITGCRSAAQPSDSRSRGYWPGLPN